MDKLELYCAYLRKSRAYRDADLQGAEETLKRHEQILTEYAEKNHIHISQFYKEVVSGDSIEARPEMQRLLSDVEAGKWNGVLVVEVERLARGNTKDQGIVAGMHSNILKRKLSARSFNGTATAKHSLTVLSAALGRML